MTNKRRHTTRGSVCLLRSIIFLLFSLACFSRATAQTSNTGNVVRRLLIDSTPSGAFVEISGAYHFVGRTPFVLPDMIKGRYSVKARQDGYETLNTHVDIARVGVKKITIKLSRRTRGKAAYRSLFLPGWGQFYGQSKFKGFLTTIGQVALGTITVFAAIDYDNEKDDYKSALADFNRRRFNLEDAETALQSVNNQLDDARDARDFRNAMLAATFSYWFLNVIDSIFLFSKGKTARSSPPQTPLILGEVGSGKVMLSMNINL